MNESFLKSFPMKRMASAALFLDEQQKILIVKPVYREHWLLPGGIVEDRESPRQACIREVKEELGLHITARKLLCIDYKIPQETRMEGIEFIFLGGVLTQETTQHIQLQTEELHESRFVRQEEAVQLLNPWSAKRLPFAMWALQEGMTMYLEDGHIVE